MAARAAPDGYTLLMGSGSVFSVNPFLYRKLGYDPVRDFSPVALLIYFPFFLVVNPGSGIRTVPELIHPQKKTNERTTTFLRQGALSGAVGSLQAVWNDQRDTEPSVMLS
jgi:tripartite-type tricarboxylate transporter receptor subunit TctC